MADQLPPKSLHAQCDFLTPGGWEHVTSGTPLLLDWSDIPEATQYTLLTATDVKLMNILYSASSTASQQEVTFNQTRPFYWGITYTIPPQTFSYPMSPGFWFDEPPPSTTTPDPTAPPTDTPTESPTESPTPAPPETLAANRDSTVDVTDILFLPR